MHADALRALGLSPELMAASMDAMLEPLDLDEISFANAVDDAAAVIVAAIAAAD